METATRLLAFTAESLGVEVIVQTTPLRTLLSEGGSAIKFVLLAFVFFCLFVACVSLTRSLLPDRCAFCFESATTFHSHRGNEQYLPTQVAGFGAVVSGGGGRLLSSASSLGPANFSGGNEALSDFATVSGGHANSAAAEFSVVSGGASNFVNTTAKYGPFTEPICLVVHEELISDFACELATRAYLI